MLKESTSANLTLQNAATSDLAETDPILHRALNRSLQSINTSLAQPSDPAKESAKRIRKLKKSLNGILDLQSRKAKGGRLNDAEVAKVNRKEKVENELRRLEEEREKRLVKAASKQKAMDISTNVKFDIRFACPICREVLEAATMVLPCRHIFCRKCIEQALQYSVRKNLSAAKQLASINCPLCRTQLFDPKAKKVQTKPARNLRKKLKKTSGTCHCGTTMPLSSLRQHLRQCGSKYTIELYGKRPEFGHHQFVQPQLHLATGAEDQRLYDEEAALQEALVESLRLAGLS